MASRRWARGFVGAEDDGVARAELKLELIQPHMAQKPVLRGGVEMAALHGPNAKNPVPSTMQYVSMEIKT